LGGKISEPGKGLMDRLAVGEADAILRNLLERHPELRDEAERIAQVIVNTPSAEHIADQVFNAITSVDLDALNERAGAHSWGYVEPSEAAIELLEESLEDWIDDMKRKAELGLTPGAEAICAGIVQGLYRARNVNSDGALGWAPDFPAEEAGHVLDELLRSFTGKAKGAAQERLLGALVARAREWESLLRRAANDAFKK